MIVNKNDLTKLPKVLVTYLGYMSIAFGLALPAYGDQGTTAPEMCTPTLTAPIARTGVTSDDEGGSNPDVGDPSSFAAGCNASAGTDGSIAIGHSAKVESYTKSVVVEAVPGVPTDTFYNDAETDHAGIPLRSAMGTLVEQDANDGDLLHVIGPNGRTGVTIRRTAGGTSALIRFTGPGSVGSITTETLGSSGIAIGNGARTIGKNSIAFGKGAEVLRTDVVGAVAGVPTDTFYNDTETDHAGIPLRSAMGTLVEQDANDGDLLHVIGPNGRTGVTIRRTAGGTSALIRFTGPGSVGTRTDNPVENGVAIGADATVTGDNGIAIGYKVTAGENEIIIGGTATTRTVIGGIDLEGISTNSGNIMTNAANISTNSGNIMTNAANISTNSGNIMTNAANISTNSGNIMTNVANISTNSGNIRINRADIAAETTARKNADTALGVRIDTNVNDIETNRAGIAMSIAFAHLPSVSAGDKGSWGIGAGSFAGKTALAVGISYRVQTNGVIKAGVSSSGGETSFGVGFGKGF